MEPSDRWKHLKSLFDEIVDLDPAARAQFLDDRCGGDAELRRRLLELLHAHASADRFLASPTAAEATAILPSSSAPGQGGAIGPYRLLQQIGEGGFGVVYIAEQRHPIARRVALKVLRPGMDTQEVIARFESERQALAILDHPGIAKVFDAGVTEQGRPYFAMEYVAGVPITTHCDERKLSIPQRLQLFAQVCDAVQHAHQRGIIHRDIKPSNVLVTMVDDRPAPKIIDFGVAKATGAKLSDRSLYTQHGLVLGTPEYMSPEQAGAIAVPVDTRSDVYALGILLYELLVGARPFDVERFKEAALAEVLRVIREEEAPKLTTRLSSLGASASEIAQRRQVDPRALARHLQGDLEWITGKALEKEPARRYASASEFAADVRRHLADEPVLAGAPSRWYRFSKYAKRHRVGVAFTGSVAVLIVGSTIGMAILASRLAGQRDRANAEAATSHEVEKFLIGLFESPNPDNAKGTMPTARDLLDRGVTEIEKLSGEPRVQARLLLAMYQSYFRLGVREVGRKVANRALDVQVSVAGSDDETSRMIRADLAGFARELGELDSAEKQFTEIYEAEVRAGRGEGFAAYEALFGLAVTLQKADRLKESQPRYETALAGLRRTVGDDHYRTLEALNGLAIVLGTQGAMDQALPLMREAYERRLKVFGPDSPATLEATQNLGYALVQLGKYAEAEPLLRAAYEGESRVLGDQNPDLINSINALATLFQSLERYSEAAPLFERALAIAETILGAEHPGTMVALNNLAVLRGLQERWPEALEPARRAYDLALQIYPADSPSALTVVANYGETLAWVGRPREARPLIDRALAVAQRTWPDGHAVVGRTLRKKAMVLMNAGDFAAAEVAALEAHRQLVQFLGTSHANTRLAMRSLAMLYDRWGRPDKAQEWRSRLAEAPHSDG